MTLTHTQCKSAKTKEKAYKLTDGGGLYLHVMPNGSKYWRLKYRIHKKEKLLSIGVYPLISLAEAREERTKAKKLLADDIDPSEFKKKTKRRSLHNSKNTFQLVALEWHNIKKEGWKTKYSNTVLSRLENDAFPLIGRTPINKIEPPDLLYVFRNVENRGAYEVSNRLMQTCGQIFRYGIQTGKCLRDPTSDLKGALKTKKTKHLACIDLQELPELIAGLQSNQARLFPRTLRAIWFSMLTFQRPGEIRQARWEDIDFMAKQWVIPAEFMKMGKSHIVPLSNQAIEILLKQKEETGHMNTPWVFPSQVRPQKPMSDGTVNVALKKMGFHGRMTAHGFRALARTVIREKLDYAPDIIEAQLAHKASGPLGEAYNRAQFLTQRKVMMQDWGGVIEGCG